MSTDILEVKARLAAAEMLVREWYAWWEASGEAKMPNALHVRTAVYLMTTGHDDFAGIVGVAPLAKDYGAFSGDLRALLDAKFSQDEDEA